MVNHNNYHRNYKALYEELIKKYEELKEINRVNELFIDELQKELKDLEDSEDVYYEIY